VPGVMRKNLVDMYVVSIDDCLFSYLRDNGSDFLGAICHILKKFPLEKIQIQRG
jgi:hypothetical protein